MTRADGPVGYFVHHQGRGHAERAAAIANAISSRRPVRLFCARDDIFPELAPAVTVTTIPSMFEWDGEEFPALANMPTPDTMHCAPLGRTSVTRAIALLAEWFATADPALFVTDVSAELGQLARISSAPHLAVLQHGERDDPGHMASYRGAVGLLAPYSETLEQQNRPGWMRSKTIYAPGVGVDCSQLTDRDTARDRLGLSAELDLVVVVGGGGGIGLPSAPLTLGARDDTDAEWITLGKINSEWHETPPGNLKHLGWVDNPEDWISAADRIVSSCGNTTVHMVAAAGKPWVVVPEWRYFSEQLCKAEALDRVGAAAMTGHWPASAQEWRRVWHAAATVRRDAQLALVDRNAAMLAANAIEALIARIWQPAAVSGSDGEAMEAS